MGPHCARHPDRDATATCPRCGSFNCLECLPPGSLNAVCVDCARLPATLPPNARLPGVFMSVIAGLNAALFGIVAPLMLYEAVTGKTIIGDDKPAELGAAILGLVIVALQIAAFVAAVQFARLKSKTLAYVSSIAVMIPCFGPCCLIGIPLGIWGLVTIPKIPPHVWDA